MTHNCLGIGVLVVGVCVDGSILEEIDGHYVMQRTADGWRFAVAVVCEGGWQGS